MLALCIVNRSERCANVVGFIEKWLHRTYLSACYRQQLHGTDWLGNTEKIIGTPLVSFLTNFHFFGTPAFTGHQLSERVRPMYTNWTFHVVEDIMGF